VDGVQSRRHLCLYSLRFTLWREYYLGSMKFVWLRKMCLCLALVLGGFTLKAVPAASVTADQIISKAVARQKQVENASAHKDYSFRKVTLTEERDSAGKLRERKERVYEISSHDGESYARLVEVNGHAPAGVEIKKQNENEISARQLMGKSIKNDNRGYFLTAEVAVRYKFSLVGQMGENGRRAFQISFVPRNPPLPQHHILDRLLDRLSGTLWIDAEEFEVARAQIQLRSEVDLLAGVVGCLRKMDYTVTRSRVAEGLWLNTDSNGDFEGRKLLESVCIKTRSQCLDFHELAMK